MITKFIYIHVKKIMKCLEKELQKLDFKTRFHFCNKPFYC